MAEQNPPGIPQEWITVKTLKTISGASLCCWLTTVFFDLICFIPIRDLKLHALLVLIVSTVSCLGLAIYKVSSYRGRKTKVLWMLVIPNAMLIYIHALGFQVASKELALRAYANEVKNEEAKLTKANMFSFLGFFAKQTSWIPSLELTNIVKRFETEQLTLRKNNKILRDSIINLNGSQMDTALLHDHSIIEPDKSSDSSFFYIKNYKNCMMSNTALKSTIDSLNNRINKIIFNYNHWKEQYAQYDKRDSILLKRIEDKNALINKWNQRMGVADMQLQRADLERVMDGYMEDESYYRRLFKPIFIDKKAGIIIGY
jgi:hypothetical protein